MKERGVQSLFLGFGRMMFCMCFAIGIMIARHFFNFMIESG